MNERVLLMVGGVTIVLTYVQHRGDKIRLGFDAPDEVVILREELVGTDRDARDGDRNGEAQRG